MFCEYCGKENDNGAKFCVSCGASLEKKTNNLDNNVQPSQTARKDDWGTNSIILGLIAFFIGYLGIHNFIMGYTGKGVAQALLSTIGCIIFIGPIISGIWAFVEAIMLFCDAIKTDARGNFLHK